MLIASSDPCRGLLRSRIGWEGSRPVDGGVQWDSTESLPQGGSFSGQEGVVQFFEGVGRAWDGLQVEIEDLLESGDQVVAVGRAQGALKGTGSAGYGFVHVFTLSDGKIVRFREYAAPDEALRGL